MQLVALPARWSLGETYPGTWVENPPNKFGGYIFRLCGKRIGFEESGYPPSRV